MSKDPKVKMTWGLTLVPEVGNSSVGDIEHTTFRFGRTSDELEYSPSQSLPSGLLHVLKESEMVDQTLETGFEIDICSAPQSREEGWFRFEMGVITTDATSRLTLERGVYVSDEGPHSVELIHVNPCCPSRLPQVIWIRARELPESSLAWVFDSGLWDSGDGGQTSLHDFSDIGVVPTPNAEGPLSLPGPPDEPYEFL
jgi:hypothetical protein